ncbi:hypothetical protein SM124_13230 [Bacillus sp. 31A1R]|uniref:Cohesin domain-containing protein n=1 Tax=Robertmurraya mangrovi TaxID=3098077 RepID=A0ABU5IZW4_9BACI|nr:hypothetical protein [Bacillus sp. 31A1R]MDZ5472695.1 hypothetical protein [Bacillus sp. 31A1R]
MGVICSCGAILNTTLFNIAFQLPEGVASGTITYNVNVCQERVESSNVTVNFGDGDPSFTLQSTNLVAVQCSTQGDVCTITITGQGILEFEGNQQDVTFQLEFRVDETSEQVSSFTIEGFGFQAEIAVLPPGTLTSFGCED